MRNEFSALIFTLILFGTLIIIPESAYAMEITSTTNILVNSDFELGPGLPWVEYSEGGFSIICSGGGFPPGFHPYNGSYVAWLGGYPNAYDYLYQDVTIPSYATSAVLIGYRYFTTEEPGADDCATIDVDGTVIYELDSTNPSQNFWVQFALDLTVYIGATHRLRIAATTDSALMTNFFFDSLELNIQYGNPDVAATNVMPSKTIVGQGHDMTINATAENQGPSNETFNVTAFANATEIGILGVSLSPGSFEIVTFAWNTSGWSKGNYTISAYATPVENETETGDNNSTDGWVFISILGDVNGDRIADITDISLVIAAYGRTSASPGWSEPPWYANRDLNDDDIIDITDISLVISQYGNYW